MFEAMLENATRICEAKFGNLLLYDGDAFRAAAHARRAAGVCRVAAARARTSFDPDTVRARPSSRRKQIVHVRRHAGGPSATSSAIRSLLALAELAGARTLLDRADAQGERADRRDRHLPPGGPAVHRQADRAGQNFRHPGRHRHREHAAAQRAARIVCSSRPPPPTCSR